MSIACMLSLCVLLDPVVAEPEFVAKYREAAVKRWDKTIQALEKLDTEEEDPEDAILFLGSSSFRRWTSMADDLAPWPSVRRAYGGSKFSDVAVFVDRLVKSHQPTAVVLFVGNDISGQDSDKSPEEVLKLYEYVVSRIQAHKSDCDIFFLAITPTPKRWDVWKEVNRVNRLVNKLSQKHDQLHFVRTKHRFLDEESVPNAELFVEDRLHLSEKGYAIWIELLKREFSKVLSQPVAAKADG